MTHDVSAFLGGLYKTQRSNRFAAWRLILRYHAACRKVFPPRKAVWGKFYNEPKGAYIHKALSEHLQAKQMSLCCYCRDKIYHRKNSNIEHILPIARYPMFAFEYSNLALACVTCNALKSHKDYFRVAALSADYTANVFDCFHPSVHDYNDHIDFILFQTNHIYVRVFKSRSVIGDRLCVEHLKDVSIYGVKEQVNPVVAGAVKKLGEFLNGKPGYENAFSALKRLADNI
ncbi:HNH endonuclease [Pseudomonas haemolytica]|uniref:HNH endonuclease n=1 Tax=Pseudomonas haemolytica TaxID=2600065 RepID=UPI00190DFC55|nr:HNH endonuclease [Pseudomonas haemolytica]MBK3449543.1 HNH endonuclease [Pseudomonas haemolytica]